MARGRSAIRAPHNPAPMVSLKLSELLLTFILS